MFCSRCGKENIDAALFCISCGNRLAAQTLNRQEMVQTPSQPGPELTKMNVLLLIFLTFISFGIYSPVWYLRKRKAINNLKAKEKLGSGVFIYAIVGAFVYVIVVGYCASIGLNFNSPDSIALQMILSLAVTIPLWFQLFKLRRILIEHFNTDLQLGINISGPATFFFNIYYLQYKINRLIEITSLINKKERVVENIHGRIQFGNQEEGNQLEYETLKSEELRKVNVIERQEGEAEVKGNLQQSPNEEKSHGLNKNISPIIAILVTLGAVIFIIIIGVAYLSPSSKEPQQPIATSEPSPSKEAGPTTQAPGTDTLPSVDETINPPPGPLENMEKEKPPLSSLPANKSSTKTPEKKLGAADWLQRGHLLSLSGNYTEAIDAYSRAIDLNPEFSTAYNDRGDAYSYLRNFQQAVRDYDKAIAFDPNFVMPYINRANAYTKLGDYSQAIRDFDKAIDLNPKDAMNYNMRGIAYDEIGNHLQAIKDYNKAIDLSPNFAAAYDNRGNAKRHLGYNQQAISDFDTAIEISPGVPVPYFNRGITYDLIGNNQLAIDDFKTAARLGHKDTQDYLKSKGISW